ncbi:MAG: type II secretion system protein GspN [Pseudomonadota bacterium]
MKRNIKLKITRYTFGYAAFAVAALILFLYLRFPGDALVRYLVASASAMNPDQVLQIDSVKPVIPPGMTFTHMSLVSRNHPRSAIQADTITIRPGYLSFLRGRTAIVFTANAYGGAIQGQADTNHFLSFRGPINWTLAADGLDIERISYLKDTLGRQITGQFKGTMAFNGQLPSFFNGTGSLEFTLINGRYPLLAPMLGIDRLDFKSVEALVHLKNGILTINKLKLTGEKINGAVSGAIVFDTADINRSEINLNCAFELPAQNRKFSMVLTGPLGNPRIRHL